jgi:hypothetical protein
MSYTTEQAEQLTRDPGALREDDPPLLRFEHATIEDREGTIRAGRFVHAPIVKVHVRARGDTKSEVPYIVRGHRVESVTKRIEKEVPIARDVLNEETGEYERTIQKRLEIVDEVEKSLVPTTPWLDQLKERLRNGRISQRYYDVCLQSLKRWEESGEIPIDGTPLATWNGVNPALIKNALELGLRSVEEVAQMTEEAMTAIGMGARDMKKRAQAYVEGTDANKAAAVITSLQHSVDEEHKARTALEEKLAQVEAKLQEAQKSKRERAA